jgi:hypothetical protein
VAFLTLTQCHSSGDRLAAVWDRQEAGWTALVTGSGWTADKQAYGVRGYIRITEVVYSPATGWNVHFHVILLLDGELDPPRMEKLRKSLAKRFVRGVSRRGGQAASHLQDLQPMTPGTEERLANYAFKDTTIDRSKDGSLTTMAILDHLERTGEGLAQWDELTAVVLADKRKRKQVVTSAGIDALCTRAPS